MTDHRALEEAGNEDGVRTGPRVLWLTNIPLPAVRSRQGLPDIMGGGWLSAALRALVAEAPYLVVVCAARSWPAPEPFDSDGVRYVTLAGEPPSNGWRGVFHAWTNGIREKVPVAEMRRLMDDTRPDMVHVHGTETSNALAALIAAAQTGTPVLVSIQGPVSEYAPLFFAGSRPMDVLSDVGTLDFVKGRGVVHAWWHMRRAAAMELEALRRTTDASGRTDWDREVVRRANPAAHYWHIDEVLRQPFYEVQWRGGAVGTPTILAVTSAAPYKGIDVLLKAFARIRESQPCRLRVVGDIVGTPLWRSLGRLEARLGLTGHVDWIGACEAGDVARMLSECDVFVCASRIENSSNSVCEAMLVGVPVVASRVGGIPSLVTHCQDGLLFESGDDEALSQAVARVLAEKDMARSLGSRARLTALARHDPVAVAHRLACVYSSLVAGVRG